MTTARDGTTLVAEKWSRFEPDTTRSFFGFDPLREYLIETAYGPALAARHKRNRFWAEDILVDVVLRGHRIRDVLSLCCGFGAVERRVVSRLGSVRSCLGLDIASGAIDAARARAASDRLPHLAYETADLNQYAWPEAAYDLILANGALHHLTALEEVLEGISRALRPGGMIYANEHVGASRLDHSSRHMELINAAAYLVPPDLRRREPLPFSDSRPLPRALNSLFIQAEPSPRARSGWLRGLRYRLARIAFDPKAFRFGALYRSQAAKLARSDPSESVRSAQVLRLFRAQFPEAEIHTYGGGILAYALDERFYEDYDDTNPRHRETLDLLCALERELMASGELGPEHAILIARKNPARRSGLSARRFGAGSRPAKRMATSSSSRRRR